MNYFALADQMIYTKHPISDSYLMESSARLINTVGVLWGLQRNWERSRLSLDLSVGPAIRFARATSGWYSYPGYNTSTSNVSEFTLLTQFNIGFWLNKRQ